jgi:RHS repeat-associated protein
MGLRDSDGNMVVDYSYDSFGNILTSSGTATTQDGTSLLREANPFRYASYFYDEETDIYYLNARYYDAEIGRFITRDLIPHVNLYVYGENNPVNFVDPSGYFSMHFGPMIDGLYLTPEAAKESVKVNQKKNTPTSSPSTDPQNSIKEQWEKFTEHSRPKAGQINFTPIDIGQLKGKAMAHGQKIFDGAKELPYQTLREKFPNDKASIFRNQVKTAAVFAGAGYFVGNPAGKGLEGAVYGANIGSSVGIIRGYINYNIGVFIWGKPEGEQ